MCVRVIVAINNTFILVINMDQTTQSWAEQEFANLIFTHKSINPRG